MKKIKIKGLVKSVCLTWDNFNRNPSVATVDILVLNEIISLKIPFNSKKEDALKWTGKFIQLEINMKTISETEMNFDVDTKGIL